MATRSLSQLGNLIKLLNISVQQLADFLHVDRTTVSKWKSGARALPESSQYFEKLIDYLVQANLRCEDMPLNSYFKKIFVDMDPDEVDYVKNCIKRSLKTNNEPTEASNIINYAKDAMYNTSVPIFRGSEGRRKAVNMLLNIAEMCSNPCEIIIMDFDQFDWLGRDMAFTQSFFKRLDLLTKKGFKVNFSFTALKDSKAIRNFQKMYSIVAFRKNVSISIIKEHSSSFLMPLMPSIYAIPNKFLVVGLNCADEQRYTSIFTDNFSNLHYISLFNKIKQTFGEQALATDNEVIKDKILNLLREKVSIKENTYCICRFLSFTTMSEELLLEILHSNQVTSLEIERCLGYYHVLKESMKNSAEDKGGYYLNLHFIREGLFFESLIQYELSAITKKRIVSTSEQFRRHLAETAELLLNDSSLNIVFIPGVGFNVGVFSVWTKNSLWHLCFNENTTHDENMLIYIEEVNHINTLTNTYKDTYYSFPSEFKDRNFVANEFLKLSKITNK